MLAVYHVVIKMVKLLLLYVVKFYKHTSYVGDKFPNYAMT